MKTLYIVSRTMVSGPINQGLNILTGMKKNGRVDAALLTLAPEVEHDSWLDRYKRNGIKIIQFNKALQMTWKCIFMLRHLVSNENIDVIHASGYRADIVALLANTKAKTVITQRCHPREIVEKFPCYLQPFFSYIYLNVIKRMDCIVACSKSIQRIFKEEYGMDVECVQNGVNTDYFKPVSKKDKDSIRKELNLPIGKRILLVLGVLIPRKNNSLIIEALRQIEDDSIKVVFVGSGSEESLLKKQSEGDERIIFAGATSLPIKYLQASDILISSSLAEGLPNTVLEALSCGLPCILSDIDPHKELIEGAEAGLLFENNNLVSLIDSISNSLKWDIETMSKKARMVAVNNFDVCTLASKYEAIYNKLLVN